MRQYIPLAISFIGIFGLTSCQDEAPVEKHTQNNILILGNYNEPAGLDHHVVTGVIESQIISSIMEGLCAQHPSKDGYPLPGAAERWEPNEDFSEWTFYLQKDGKWSDGKPVTTEDFLFAYERILHPEFSAKYASMLYYIENAEAFNKGEIKDFSKVGVKAIDSHTLHIKLRASMPFLTELTKHYTWYPIAKHAVLKRGAMTEKYTDWTDPEHYVGNGPFKLTQWRFNHKIEVAKNPHYWDVKTVKLDGIQFLPITDKYTEARMFYNDQMHITERLASEMIEYARKKSPERLREELYLGTDFIRFNVTDEKFKDPKVRHAISLATNRKLLIDKIIKGGEKPATGITPTIGDYKALNIAKHDPEEARKFMEEAGYSDSKKLKFTLTTVDKDAHKTKAEALQDMWEKALPVEVSITQREWKSYQDIMSKLEYETITGGWIGDFPDPTTFLDMWRAGDGNNRTGWANPEYDALLNKAEKAGSPKERIKLLNKAETLFLKDMPAFPVYWATHVYLIRPEVKNWHPLILKNQPYKFVWLEK